MERGSVVRTGARRSGPRSVVGARHPDADADADAGAVTVETALSLLAVVVVLAAVTWGLGLMAAQLALGEAARAGARVAARGETASAVADEVRRVAPDATVEVLDDGSGHVRVRVQRSVTGPGLLARWGTAELEASASSLLESAS